MTQIEDDRAKRDRCARRVMQEGLLAGLWSIADFNKSRGPGDYILPEPGFITAHAQFADKDYRDLVAFRNNPNRRISL